MNLTVQPDLRIIKRRTDIKEILQKSRRIKTRYGTFYCRTGQMAVRRIAVLIKKNVGNAVERNYRKRIVREYLRNEFHSAKTYNDIIFLYNYKGEVSYRELVAEFSYRLAVK